MEQSSPAHELSVITYGTPNESRQRSTSASVGPITQAATSDADQPGGSDTITGSGGAESRNVVLGGAEGDVITLDASTDVVLADFGTVLFTNGSLSRVTTRQWDGLGDPSAVDANFEVITSGGSDTVTTGEGDDGEGCRRGRRRGWKS